MREQTGLPAPLPIRAKPAAGGTRGGTLLKKSGCACGGGCASCQPARMAGPDHPAEREAEAVANHVLSMPDRVPTVQQMAEGIPVQRMEE
ncbi:MAG: FeoB-associated Cys-rich membrane protein, partial [Pseudomonadota bacterium]